jgi:site-specific recombinase XerD
MNISHESIDRILLEARTDHTRRAYRRSLTDFSAWLDSLEITYDRVIRYRNHLQESGKTAQNINQVLAAIRYYLRELVKHRELPSETAEAICAIKGLTVKGKKTGNWLTLVEAQSLINSPDTSTPLGVRDRAILGLLIGAGLRRSECANLKFAQIEKREGRWILADVTGKHGRIRTIPIADWVKALLDVWFAAAEISTGPAFRAVSWSEKKFWVKPDSLAPTTIHNVVQRYGWNIDRPRIAPHDMRRTFARLAYDGKSPVAQIQLVLGHASQVTTESYINATQDLQTSPSDLLGIQL